MLLALSTEAMLETGLPSVLCPSDHAPIQARCRVLPAPAGGAETQAAAGGGGVSPERQAEMEAQWQELRSRAPSSTKGRPSPEAIQVMQAHAAEVKVWIGALATPGESDLAQKLKKK